jgi:hypothetical protein
MCISWNISYSYLIKNWRENIKGETSIEVSPLYRKESCSQDFRNVDDSNHKWPGDTWHTLFERKWKTNEANTLCNFNWTIKRRSQRTLQMSDFKVQLLTFVLIREVSVSKLDLGYFYGYFIVFFNSSRKKSC